jgi:hypothetical protein
MTRGEAGAPGTDGKRPVSRRVVPVCRPWILPGANAAKEIGDVRCDGIGIDGAGVESTIAGLE